MVKAESRKWFSVLIFHLQLPFAIGKIWAAIVALMDQIQGRRLQLPILKSVAHLTNLNLLHT